MCVCLCVYSHMHVRVHTHTGSEFENQRNLQNIAHFLFQVRMMEREYCTYISL